MVHPIISTEEGYSTKLKVFRFDGSKRVRLRCSVDVCLSECPPVSNFISKLNQLIEQMTRVLILQFSYFMYLKL